MEHPLTDKRICGLLSDLFLDTEIDYPGIAGQLIEVDLERLETLFLDAVGPQLWSVMMAVAPEWAGYNEDFLWEEIQKSTRFWSNPGFIKRPLLSIRRALLRNFLEDTWQKFESAYRQAQAMQIR